MKENWRGRWERMEKRMDDNREKIGNWRESWKIIVEKERKLQQKDGRKLKRKMEIN